MSLSRLYILTALIFTTQYCVAQGDSTIQSLQQLPLKYINQIDSKIEKYSNRITGKTEKTLTKLSRWENKIKTLLQKASPETAERLFGEGKTTFTTLLHKYKEGQTITEGYKARYDEYRDKLITSIKYIEQQKQNLVTKIVQPVNKATKKLQQLDDEVKQQETVEAFIKERKKQLISEAVKYMGSSKYLTKINKESYYYVETIKNYKEIFSDKKKAEQTALTILNKIPAFTKFVQQNSMLAQLFGSPTAMGTAASLAGLQTRASVNALIQNQIAAGGPNAQQIIQQNIQQAQSELNKLKDKVLKAGGSSSDMEIPDFKPRETKTKTFLQRIEITNNFQLSKSNSLLPSVADIAVGIGYKLNDKSVLGIAGSYKMGLGSTERIRITHQGFGMRSFVDWKLKKQFFVSGGFEMNYNAQFKNITQLKNYNDWQQSGLVGLTKKINIKTKWFKGTSIQLLYDMLYRQHLPTSQPVLFRTGYSFK